MKVLQLVLTKGLGDLFTSNHFENDLGIRLELLCLLERLISLVCKLCKTIFSSGDGTKANEANPGEYLRPDRVAGRAGR